MAFLADAAMARAWYEKAKDLGSPVLRDGSSC